MSATETTTAAQLGISASAPAQPVVLPEDIEHEIVDLRRRREQQGLNPGMPSEAGIASHNRLMEQYTSAIIVKQRQLRELLDQPDESAWEAERTRRLRAASSALILQKPTPRFQGLNAAEIALERALDEAAKACDNCFTLTEAHSGHLLYPLAGGNEHPMALRLLKRLGGTNLGRLVRRHGAEALAGERGRTLGDFPS